MRVRNRKAPPEVSPKKFVGFARLFQIWAELGDEQTVDGVMVQRIARRVGINRPNRWLEREGWILRADDVGYRSFYKAGPNMGRDLS
jgi:hypothetical protein